MAIALIILAVAIYATVIVAHCRVRDRINDSERARFNEQLDQLKAFDDESTVIFLTRNHPPAAPRPSEFAALSVAI
ncbi:MAG: hypothetical protein ACR2OH_13655 [Microthrixaceae bacterium]